jgi:RecB family exonuclease
MTITNNLNLPAGLVKAVSTERHNANGCLSATTLLQGVKHLLLTDRHWEQLADDVADRIWAIWGTAVHSLLESEGENDFTEQEMSHKIGGITVTGRIDNYNMASGTICDYKTASVNKVKFSDFSDWYLQGMIYAWLLTRNKFPVTHCRFIALLKDHSKTEAQRDRQYPQNPVLYYAPHVAGQR